MTAPLVPAEVDLRDFAFMPLDVVRLRDSDLVTKATGDQFRCAVMLWCASWHQVPPASLPDDDEVLAQLAGFGRVVKEWRKVRAGSLRGWILCDDGRLYHPVVAEKAMDAWRGKLKQRWTTAMAALKKYCQRHELPYRPIPFEDWLTSGRPEGQALYVPGTPPLLSPGHAPSVPGDDPPMSPQKTIQGTGIGIGRGTGTVEPNPPPGGLSPAPVEPPPLTLVPPAPITTPPCPHQEIVDAYHRILPALPRVREWGETRRTHLASRWKARPKRQSLEWWERLFAFAAESPFLTGHSPGRNGAAPFVMTLPWLVKSEENLVKVIEGNYHWETA